MPRRSVSSSHPTSNMPARLDEDSAAGPGGAQQAASTAAASGHGRKARASRSATVGASQRASLNSTKPPQDAEEPRPRPVRTNPQMLGLGGQSNIWSLLTHCPHMPNSGRYREPQ